LQQEVKDKHFREDLFYRINVLTIQLPPLRQRAGDLKLLVEHMTTPDWHLEPEVLPILERYSWPGNVRQLQNALDRAKILADHEVIRAENLPPEIVNSAHLRSTTTDSDLDLDTLTREHVLDTYQRHDNNKARTARALGIGRRTLYRLLEKYNISEVDIERQMS
jgi:transcriptional regulator with PAS, ATPase and Fis domain